MAVIIDGRKIAEEVVQELMQKRTGLPPVLKLGVVMGTADSASASFVRIKERVADRLHVVVVREFLHEAVTTAEALRAVERLSNTTAGVIVQLPLPHHIDANQVLAAIPPERDIDAVNTSVATLVRPVRAPVAEAIAEIFSRTGVDPKGKKAVVVGAGRLVGVPAAALLAEMGSVVTVVTREQSLRPLKSADIVVLGAGTPGMIKSQMLKQGVVLIDAGTSEQGGKLSGDAEAACSEVAEVFTPVPGGVGPIAVAMIFKNLFTLAGAA